MLEHGIQPVVQRLTECPLGNQGEERRRIEGHHRYTGNGVEPLHQLNLLLGGQRADVAQDECAVAVRRQLQAGLAGLAALAVVLFHYTVRYDELFTYASPPLFRATQGFYGVEFFFGISGFVIFMTLDRSRRAMDFVVSRFSRLWPALALVSLMIFAGQAPAAEPVPAADATVDAAAAVPGLATPLAALVTTSVTFSSMVCVSHGFGRLASTPHCVPFA